LKLALDSSQTSGSIAISANDRVIYSAYLDIRITHSETLMPALDSAMRTCGFSPQDIEELYVCLGPGSFTGLRIGLATAKGIAYAQDIPVYGFSSLELAALPCTISGKNILSLIDARMSEVYAAGFNANLQPTIPACVTSPEAILDWDISDFIPCGNGIAIVEKAFCSAGKDLPKSPGFLRRLRAEMLFDLPKYIEGQKYSGQGLAELEPLYIRQSTAQIRKQGN